MPNPCQPLLSTSLPEANTAQLIMPDMYRLFALGALVVLGIVLSRRQKRDPREPPAVGSSIPIIGHLLGLLWYGTEYFSLMA